MKKKPLKSLQISWIKILKLLHVRFCIKHKKSRFITTGFFYDFLLKNMKDFSGRGSETRTHSPSLPKRVRYQLRHAPYKILSNIDSFQIFSRKMKEFLGWMMGIEPMTLRTTTWCSTSWATFTTINLYKRNWFFCKNQTKYFRNLINVGRLLKKWILSNLYI